MILQLSCFYFFVFFFNDTATTEIYTLSLHDALPISSLPGGVVLEFVMPHFQKYAICRTRSEEHTSELQSLTNLVCRLLLEKKKNNVSLSLAPFTITPFGHRIVFFGKSRTVSLVCSFF